MNLFQTDLFVCLVQRSRVLPMTLFKERPQPRLLLSENELELWRSRLSRLLEQLAEVAPLEPILVHSMSDSLVLELGPATRSLTLVLDDLSLRGLYRPVDVAPGAEVVSVDLPAEPDLADLALLVGYYRGAPQWQVQVSRSSSLTTAMLGVVSSPALRGARNSASSPMAAFATY